MPRDRRVSTATTIVYYSSRCALCLDRTRVDDTGYDGALEDRKYVHSMQFLPALLVGLRWSAATLQNSPHHIQQQSR